MGLGKALLVGIAMWQGRYSLEKTLERGRKYTEADAYAKAMGKPLLVVGGPYGWDLGHWFHMKAHGCGDTCLDLDARACDGCLTVVADVKDIPFPDGYFGAALVSHVLEHLPTVDDAEQAVEELYRVADEVFVLSPSKSGIFGWFHPGHHLWVKQDRNGISIEPWPSH